MKKNWKLWLRVFVLAVIFTVGVSGASVFVRAAADSGKAYVAFQYSKRSQFRLSSNQIRQGDTGKVSLKGKTVNSVSWSSSRPSVLTVSRSGKVTAKRAGTSTITAKYKNGKAVYRLSVTIQVVDRWNAEQKKFPTGSYWNDGEDADKVTWKPCNHNSAAGGSGFIGCHSDYFVCRVAGFRVTGYQCHGFALKVASDIYGKEIAKWQYVTKYRAPKVGDVIRLNDAHTIIVTKVYTNRIQYADCNGNGNCQIQWGQTMSRKALKEAFTYMYSAK